MNKQDLAHEYALNTTNTRCSHMGRCEDCPIRFCDFKSRYEAYLAGYESANDTECKTIHKPN